MCEETNYCVNLAEFNSEIKKTASGAESTAVSFTEQIYNI